MPYLTSRGVSRAKRGRPKAPLLPPRASHPPLEYTSISASTWLPGLPGKRPLAGTCPGKVHGPKPQTLQQEVWAGPKPRPCSRRGGQALNPRPCSRRGGQAPAFSYKPLRRGLTPTQAEAGKRLNAK